MGAYLFIYMAKDIAPAKKKHEEFMSYEVNSNVNIIIGLGPSAPISLSSMPSYSS